MPGPGTLTVSCVVLPRWMPLKLNVTGAGAIRGLGKTSGSSTGTISPSGVSGGVVSGTVTTGSATVSTVKHRRGRGRVDVAGSIDGEDFEGVGAIGKRDNGEGGGAGRKGGTGKVASLGRSRSRLES